MNVPGSQSNACSPSERRSRPASTKVTPSGGGVRTSINKSPMPSSGNDGMAILARF